jgi:hypothetical protein
MDYFPPFPFSFTVLSHYGFLNRSIFRFIALELIKYCYYEILISLEEGSLFRKWFLHANILSFPLKEKMEGGGKPQPRGLLLSYMIKLIPCNRVFTQKLIITWIFKKFPTVYGTRKLNTPSTRVRHCTISCQMNPAHTLQPYFSYVHFNITLPSIPTFSKDSVPFRLFDRNF